MSKRFNLLFKIALLVIPFISITFLSSSSVFADSFSDPHIGIFRDGSLSDEVYYYCSECLLPAGTDIMFYDSSISDFISSCDSPISVSYNVFGDIFDDFGNSILFPDFSFSGVSDVSPDPVFSDSFSNLSYSFVMSEKISRSVSGQDYYVVPFSYINPEVTHLIYDNISSSSLSLTCNSSSTPSPTPTSIPTPTSTPTDTPTPTPTPTPDEINPDDYEYNAVEDSIVKYRFMAFIVIVMAGLLLYHVVIKRIILR